MVILLKLDSTFFLLLLLLLFWTFSSFLIYSFNDQHEVSIYKFVGVFDAFVTNWLKWSNSMSEASDSMACNISSLKISNRFFSSLVKSLIGKLDQILLLSSIYSLEWNSWNQNHFIESQTKLNLTAQQDVLQVLSIEGKYWMQTTCCVFRYSLPQMRIRFVVLHSTLNRTPQCVRVLVQI